MEIANLGDPIRLHDLNLAGVSAESARPGEDVKVWTRMALTSDQDLFQKIIGNLASVIEHHAREAGAATSLRHARTVLLVLHPDNSGELWVDTAAVCSYSALKRPGVVPAGSVLFENDIADISGMWFPRANINSNDRILCIFREGWRFGLFFDLNRDQQLDIEAAKWTLGSLLRRMRYADHYAAIAHIPTFQRLIAAGWFPFLELSADEFQSLAAGEASDLAIDTAAEALLNNFTDERIDRMFSRWEERSYLKNKSIILAAAVRSYKAKEPVSVIKIVLSEIEGIMSEAYFNVKGTRTHRTGLLLDFMIAMAEMRAGGRDTLFFPVEFGIYLKNYIYAGFNPGDIGSAGSRHAVSHGAVAGDEYTMVRALQAMLTLDQVAFYV